MIPTTTIQHDQIPDVIREHIGKTWFARFMEEIRDPEKKQKFDELGKAFLERKAREERKCRC